MFRGFLGIFIKGLEKNNPEALLENEKENLRKQVASFNDALATHAGNVEKLLATSKRLETEEKDLRLKIPTLISAGKRDVAGQLAVRLQSIGAQHDDVVAQLTESENQYKELTKARDAAVSAATRKIEELSVGLNDMKIKRAAAEMAEMATGMVTSIGSSGDSLNRISAMIDDERAKAAGRARVASDSMTSAGLTIDIDTETALADAALAQFESDYGLLPEPKTDPLEELLRKPVKKKKVKQKVAVEVQQG